MAISRVTFGDWTPDQPGITNGLQRAENVYPKAVGYGAINAAEDYSADASENLTNVVAAKTSATGSTVVIAGGATTQTSDRETNGNMDRYTATPTRSSAHMLIWITERSYTTRAMCRFLYKSSHCRASAITQ